MFPLDLKKSLKLYTLCKGGRSRCDNSHCNFAEACATLSIKHGRKSKCDLNDLQLVLEDVKETLLREHNHIKTLGWAINRNLHPNRSFADVWGDCWKNALETKHQ